MAYFVEMRTRPVTVAETAVFMRQAGALWSNDERFEFVDFIARNPEAGDLVPASGGVRKVRWGRQGSGKRGGVRVIYFYHDPGMPLYRKHPASTVAGSDQAAAAWGWDIFQCQGSSSCNLAAG